MSAETAMGLMRNLGQFVGHLVAGFRADPAAGGSGAAPGARRETRRTVDEARGPEGVILRRTIIDEVEVPAPRRPEASDHAS